MRIGIDARLISQTGVGRYIRNLIASIKLLDYENEYFIYLRSQEFDKFELPSKLWNKRLLNIPWHSFAEQIKVPFQLLIDKLDLVHFPYFNIPIFYPQKYLLTVHDLIIDHFDTGKATTLPKPFYKLKRFGYRLITSLGIQKSVAIATISNTTKQELLDHYRVNPNKITITYDSLDLHFLDTQKRFRPKRLFPFNYILYVGNAYPHKNLERLIQSMKNISRTKNKLVLAGDDEFFYPRIMKYAKLLGLNKEIVYFGNANDRELVNLYSFAKCLVFPSLMEGFGLPNLEALACNCLPVISDIPVFREIWSNELNYFNALDINDMSSKIFTVLNLSKQAYQKKVLSAKKRLSDFSWRTTALQTLEIYKKYAPSNRL
ncbi:hypothetical protein A2960_01050 [Candidatus Gottesmanbacteria bacterium RIFCSPLOWO2_01_FULL_39_12b]|uniref:Glycosyl transferase family 1 domain-containing protein n=1 Tax=Candidatus Gottesmanbacteria bacterium RIFCSPLOWO2_01_FULL_39_12b TaxID=1798388 RepID=A0A1F6AQH0_9BACT|nr:MAG: hypothetical protein A2960_01050 [Candidatus Gottesmanbacteria bacterium RIFCSPLOWO2_01_FULL_39_12b]